MQRSKSSTAGLVHEWLTFHLVRLLIAPLGTQCVGEQRSRLPLRDMIAAREREALRPQRSAW
jgi:hypothetical protein